MDQIRVKTSVKTLKYMTALRQVISTHFKLIEFSYIFAHITFTFRFEPSIFLKFGIRCL